MSVAKTEKASVVDRLKKLYRGVSSEMKKVHWPNRRELTAFTIVVILSVLIIGFAIWIIDSGVGYLMNMLVQ